ncbi:MAG: SecDF P1 head subdomain-containing protein [Gemmataceae bacterium]
MAESAETNDVKSSKAGQGPIPLNSLWPARFLILVFTLFGLGSAIAFVFQVRYRDPFGDLFRDQPGAWPHLIGHLIRGAVGLALAWSAWRYVKAHKKLARDAPDALQPFFQALGRWWTVMTVGVTAMLLYALWIAFIVGPMSASRSLSPRYRAGTDGLPPAQVEFRLAEFEPGVGLTEATAPGSAKKVYLHKEPLITNFDIAEAQVREYEEGEPQIIVHFTAIGEQKMLEATTSHIGKPMAILVDGKVVTAPTIRSRISSSLSIVGHFTLEEADRIARSLGSQK